MLPMLIPDSPMRRPLVSSAPGAAHEGTPRRQGVDRVAKPRPTDDAGRAKKRVITAARKEQNREAQRAYRQRQREQRRQLSDESEKRTSGRQRVLKPRPGPSGSDISQQRPLSQGPAGVEEVLLETEEPGSVSDTVLPPLSPVPATLLSSSDTSDELGLNLLGPDQLPYEQIPLSYSDDDLSLTRVRRSPSRVEEGDASVSSEVAAFNPTSSMHAASFGYNRDSYFFADVYMNAMQFLPTTIFTAIIHNAIALGIDPGDLINCNVDCTSPFYSPFATPEDDPGELLVSRTRAPSAISVRRDMEGMPEKLRPTTAQFLIPHHVSLDLIPLPALRHTAIMLSGALPHMFNTWELKLDIYVRGGLTVWRRSNPNAHGIPCQPWDGRFWEASPWFLRKWSMAIGGEESDLSKQSHSWRALRNGRTPIGPTLQSLAGCA